MATSLFNSETISQPSFDFPEPLTEKYRPKRLADFVGLEKPRKAMQKLCDKPFPSAWFFLGNSGTGKTTMALALASEMPAELHHIASKECTLETVQDIARQCHFMPRMFNDWQSCRMHVVVVDEADQASYPAQLAFLSLLDATRFPPNTIFIFTGNSVENMEARFLSRCHVLEFSSYGIASEATQLLSDIWEKEAGATTEKPNFGRIVKESSNNIRASLMRLETELMCR